MILKILLFLVKEKDFSLYPDDNFENYVSLEDGNLNSSYTKEEAAYRNNLMAHCIQVCENNNEDIYEVMIPALFNSLDLSVRNRA